MTEETTSLAERPAEALPAEHVAEGPAALMRVIERAALDPTFDIERLNQLLDVKERWDREEARKAYYEALAAAQANMPVVEKNKHVYFQGRSGPPTDYWHADYGNLIRTIAPVLAAEGLSYDHVVEQSGGEITVTCVLTHERGHSKSVTMSAPPDDSGNKNVIQQVKSTTTYLKRATFEAVTGAATADDDDDGRGYAGADATISAEQIARLNAKIDQIGADREGFLRYCKVDQIEDLPAAKFQQAMQALEERAKQAKQAKRVGDENPQGAEESA